MYFLQCRQVLFPPRGERAGLFFMRVTSLPAASYAVAAHSSQIYYPAIYHGNQFRRVVNDHFLIEIFGGFMRYGNITRGEILIFCGWRLKGGKLMARGDNSVTTEHVGFGDKLETPITNLQRLFLLLLQIWHFNYIFYIDEARYFGFVAITHTDHTGNNTTAVFRPLTGWPKVTNCWCYVYETRLPPNSYDLKYLLCRYLVGYYTPCVL